MARSLTYLDIPVEIRQESASKARSQLQAMLVNPAYTQEQRDDILRQITALNSWEAGTIQGTGLPVATPAKGTGPGAIKPGF